jgi:putative peptide zinc metalloprotease protein
MSTLRRSLAVLALLPGLLFFGAAPAAADDDNTAVAVNTEDGASVFRLAFSVRHVANGVIDETNSAYALASCTDCQTIALAFQVVLAHGDVDVAVPENRAVAYNDQCVECVTYASAMQIVLGFDGPVRFTAEGQRRLAALHKTLRQLEERAATLTVTQLNAEVQAAKAELVAILEQELVKIETGPAEDRDEDTSGDVGAENVESEPSTTSSTGPAGATTTSTPRGATTTTALTTATSATTSTTSMTTSTNGSSSTTTTTAEPATTTTSSEGS